MINPKILVTGATGKTGGAVVTELLAKGWPVRAAVRVRDARSDLLQRRGAEIVVADIFDPGQLMDAMRGVQRAYYCPPYHPFVIQSASAFAAAARGTGLEQIVGLWQWLAGPNHPSLMTRQLWLIDRMFAALPGIAHTVVNPASSKSWGATSTTPNKASPSPKAYSLSGPRAQARRKLPRS